MKNNQRFMDFMTIVSKWVFGLHLTLLILFTLFDYVDIFGLARGGEFQFTHRGNVDLVERDWKPVPSDSVTLKTDDKLSPIVLLRKSGFVRLDYSSFWDALSGRSILFFLLDLACYWVWLVITFQLMKILNSIRKKVVFHSSIVRRLKWIGLIFFLLPVIVVIRDYLFTHLVVSLIDIPNHIIFFPSAFKFVPIFIRAEVIGGFAIMLLFFVLSEVFRYGVSIKNENDLTV